MQNYKTAPAFWLLCCLLFLAPRVTAQTAITSLSEITDMAGNYKLSGNITASTGVSGTFTGTFDGGMYTITGLTEPLFETVNGATICNVMLDNVQIPGHSGNTGAIAGTANGASRIYNCGVLGANSRIGGTGYTGSIVGQLDDTSRVINCFSYATITAGTTVGGIVGYNAATSNTSSNIRTLIVNCMFYGNITGGSSRYPIYGGNNITNAGRTGINNYNYFRHEANLGTLAGYNCALAAEERFLRRWEFYRGILNSNRALMAWYISGSTADTARVAKWVQDPNYPYPILKKWGRYPSQINSSHVLNLTTTPTTNFENIPDYDYSINYDIDYNNTEQVTALNNKLATHFCGAELGVLKVNVNCGTHGTGTHAAIYLPITDMDTHTLANRYDYCFRKVQLPYYNDLFGTSSNPYGNNYGEYVVTGWDISNVVGNSTNTFVAADNATGYNFADTLDTGKDLVRTFAQGGYYYVPKDVTEITITAHWGKAVYVSDPNYDKTYNASYETATNFSPAGSRPNQINGRTVHVSLADAINAVSGGNTVYDNAIVLVGNVHQFWPGTWGGFSPVKNWNKGNDTCFTVMSADFDKDNEPDNCLIYQHGGRPLVSPVRFDFLWQPGIGVTAKVDGSSTMPNVGIFLPVGHFEITETAIAHYYEFEYEHAGKSTKAPLILNNGVFEQFVSTEKSATGHTSYILLGGHSWMKAFNNGKHTNTAGNQFTPHIPISVMGGEFPQFYLSGIFMPLATVNPDDAECYINGGKFGEMAGAGQEQIEGNVTFKINHAIIDEFYGGGINNANPITGNIDVTINNSVVNKYCGAAKFGIMNTSGTTPAIVTTNATGTVFGTYFGAGNGGTSIYRYPKENNENTSQSTIDGWANSYYNSNTNSLRRGQMLTISSRSVGIITGYEYEYFFYAGGMGNKVGRYYLHCASFDAAQTNNVNSTLDRCLVKTHFYGGGNLGAVNGTATSILSGTIVRGDAFGGGFSATIPTVDVYPSSPIPTAPQFNTSTGVFSPAVLPTPTTYTWSNQGSTTNTLIDNGAEHFIHTGSDLTTLGTVTGSAKITVNGKSRIYGSLYGGGAMSKVVGNTFVTVDDDAKIDESVYGGGFEGEVSTTDADTEGHTFVNIQGNASIGKNVYGGGNAGVVGGSTHVQVGGNEWQQPTATQP